MLVVVSLNRGMAATSPESGLRLVTDGPAVFSRRVMEITNAFGDRLSKPSAVFQNFVPASLNNLVWTNLIAHTNGRSTQLWAERSHPPGWPRTPPIARWNTNCLLYGMKGQTALSPCWDREGASGQAPITALTRRHGYTRGHDIGPEGFSPDLVGRKVWFVTSSDELVEATIAGAITRTVGGPFRQDYTVMLFKEDLPLSIQPLRVVAITNLAAKYTQSGMAPRPLFKTEQTGNVSADVPGFAVNTWKAGDSGSPDMLPLPGELIFSGGRSTSGPSKQMQEDMDQLCTRAHLDPRMYQMEWLDLSGFPSY
jgi:hypothetical protein